jgi:hypothetical protein
MPDFRHVVRDAYLDILRRPADPGGLEFHNRLMNDGTPLPQVREGLLRSPEYAQRFPDAPAPGDRVLHVEGNQFVDARGRLVRLQGSIICCEEAKANGWPLIDLDVLDLFAEHQENYTHCRLGPFTVAGEDDPIYVGYVTTPDGRVDLNQFNPQFFERCRAIAAHALELGIYVEFDLVDRWVRQHGASDLPQIDPWSSGNNIQGTEAGTLAIFERAPRSLHETWIRKVVSELGGFDNVLFQVGNEGFKSFSVAWEVGVYDIVKGELRQHGFGDRLVATNTNDPGLESQLDYITRHSQQAQQPGAKPILVNEYPGLSSEEVLAQVRDARRMGTAFMYWRGDHARDEWERTLVEIEREIERSDVSAVSSRRQRPRA